MSSYDKFSYYIHCYESDQHYENKVVDMADPEPRNWEDAKRMQEMYTEHPYNFPTVVIRAYKDHRNVSVLFKID